MVAAVASYLDAKKHRGQWLVRLEDIDPPREQRGARKAIYDALDRHGLHSDEAICRQSRQLEFYADAIMQLGAAAYPCSCNRRRIQRLNGVYDGHCRRSPPTSDKATALRLKIDRLPPAQLAQAENYCDIFQGRQRQSLAAEVGDFILRRKDNLFAYQLAVVVDDIRQRITHVIRGYDLLSSTARQRYLFFMLGSQPPSFGHLPVATNAQGQKLSKQHHAKPLDLDRPLQNLYDVLAFLNIAVPVEVIEGRYNVQQLLRWAVRYWHRECIAGKQHMVAHRKFY